MWVRCFLCCAGERRLSTPQSSAVGNSNQAQAAWLQRTTPSAEQPASAGAQVQLQCMAALRNVVHTWLMASVIAMEGAREECDSTLLVVLGRAVLAHVGPRMLHHCGMHHQHACVVQLMVSCRKVQVSSARPHHVESCLQASQRHPLRESSAVGSGGGARATWVGGVDASSLLVSKPQVVAEIGIVAVVFQVGAKRPCARGWLCVWHVVCNRLQPHAVVLVILD